MAREESFFDELARGLAEGSINRRRALKLIAGTAIASVIPSRVLAQQQKVTICHKPGTPAEKTMEVPPSALHGHLRHGDRLDPCGTTTTSTTETPTTSTTETPTTSTTETPTTTTTETPTTTTTETPTTSTTETPTTSTTETPTTTTTPTPTACTAGTMPCSPGNANSLCYDNANGMGTTCACGFGDCADDCSTCGAGFICVSTAGAGSLDGCALTGRPFRCVLPC